MTQPPDNQAFSQHTPFTPPPQPSGPVNAPAPPPGMAGQPMVGPDPTMMAWRRKDGARALGQGHTFVLPSPSPLSAAIGGIVPADPMGLSDGSAPAQPMPSTPLPLQAAIRGTSTPPSQQGQNAPLLQALRQTMQSRTPQVNL